MELMFLLNALLRKKWVIIVCTLAGIGAGLLISFTKKKLYLSAAQYSTGFTMKQKVMLGDDAGSGVMEVDQRFKNVIETFKSPVVIAMVSYNILLHDLNAPGDSLKFKNLDENAKKKPAYTEAMADVEKMKQTLLEKKATKSILKAYNPDEKKIWELLKLYGYDNESILNTLVVDRVAGTDYLNILFRSENPEMSAYVVNTIGEEFIRFYNSLSVKRTEESAVKLDTLARKKKEEIDSLNRALQSYKASFGTPDVTDNAKGSLEIVREGFTKQADVSNELNKLRAELSSVNTQLELYKGTPSASNSGGSNAEYISLINRNRELAVEMARKPGGFDAELNNEITANQKKIQQLQMSAKGSSGDAQESRKKKDELNNKKIELENQIKAQEQTLATIGSTIKTYEIKGRQGAGADIKVSAMQAQIEMANKQYETMLNRLQGAQDINLAPDINFKQTLLGQPAIKPESSNRKALLSLSAIAAMLISSLIIIILDFTDKSLRAASVFSRMVDIKLLAATPNLQLAKTTVSSFFEKDIDAKLSGTASKLTDSMRKLRYEIEASRKKIILFTSTKSKEGKSTIIEALANSFSQARKKVLLIDANFANNSLTQRFEAKTSLEIFSEALNIKDFNVRLMEASSPTNIVNCNIIGCNSGNYSPAEVLPNNNLMEHLNAVLAQYDFVLIEGSNLNERSDTKELAKYVDGIIPVFSARSSIKHQDTESTRFLRDQNDKLIGAVLNNIDKDNINI